ncbi:PE-PGRS family protein PE_PGRS18 [Methylococcales bacterium]|nr:PE-PGRS family protein PE_PGRS18 [Methylococcales bacterium]
MPVQGSLGELESVGREEISAMAFLKHPALTKGAAALAAAFFLTGVAQAEPFAYITNQKGNSVSVIDTSSGKVIDTLALPPGSEPAGVAVSRDGSTVCVANPGSKDITVIDGQSRKIVGKVPVGTGGVGVALSVDGQYAFAADWFERNIAVVDVKNLSVVRRIPVGNIPAGLVASRAGENVYVSNRDDDTLSEIDLKTWTVKRTVKVGKHPFGIHLSEDGTKLYSANVESNDLSVVDLATFTLSKTVTVGDRPYAVGEAQGRLFVTNQYDASVSVIDTKDLKPVATIKVGEYPEGIATHPDGKQVYVANWMGNSVSVIDASELKVVNTIPTGDGSRAFGEFIARGKH